MIYYLKTIKPLIYITHVLYNPNKNFNFKTLKKWINILQLYLLAIKYNW